MSDPAAALRAVAFGTPDGGLWGAAFERGAGAFVAGDGSTAGALDAVVWSEADDGAWQLSGAGTELTVTAVDPPLAEDGTALGSVSGEGPELCRVRGSLAVTGTAELDAVGVRAVLTPPRSAKDAPASVRFVAAWFAGGGAIGLLAARSRRSAHQDGDGVAAGVFDPREWVAVSDPRLSTTYDAAGVPRRMNLELWVGEGDREYPRRAAGEASGPGVSDAVDGLALQVVPLTCHSRDETGAGVYALVTL